MSIGILEPLALDNKAGPFTVLVFFDSCPIGGGGGGGFPAITVSILRLPAGTLADSDTLTPTTCPQTLESKTFTVADGDYRVRITAAGETPASEEPITVQAGGGGFYVLPTLWAVAAPTAEVSVGGSYPAWLQARHVTSVLYDVSRGVANRTPEASCIDAALNGTWMARFVVPALPRKPRIVRWFVFNQLDQIVWRDSVHVPPT